MLLLVLYGVKIEKVSGQRSEWRTLVTTQVLEKTEATQEVSACRHYWVVEPPAGETSRGVCKLCGAARRFPNSPQGFVGEAERSASFATSSSNEITKLVEERGEGS